MSIIAVRLLMMTAAAVLTVMLVLSAVSALDARHQNHPRPVHFDE